MKQVNIAHAHTERYRQMLKDIAKDGVCPFCVDFCQDKPPKYHPNPILVETEWWIATENVSKYEGAVLHLLLVPKEHVYYPWALPVKVWADLQEIQAAIQKRFSLRGGALLMRFGNTDVTGGSVTHLHAQLIVGASRQEGTEPLMAYIGYKKPR